MNNHDALEAVETLGISSLLALSHQFLEQSIFTPSEDHAIQNFTPKNDRIGLTRLFHNILCQKSELVLGTFIAFIRLYFPEAVKMIEVPTKTGDPLKLRLEVLKQKVQEVALLRMQSEYVQQANLYNLRKWKTNFLLKTSSMNAIAICSTFFH